MSRHRLSTFVCLAALSVALLAGASLGMRSAVVAAGPAAASTNSSDVTINENELKRTIDCKGGSVTVNGNENVLTLKGECSTLKVNGNDNTVTVEAVAEIAAWGNRNKVTWTRGVGGRPPKISNPGTGNTIRRAEK